MCICIYRLNICTHIYGTLGLFRVLCGNVTVWEELGPGPSPFSFAHIYVQPSYSSCHLANSPVQRCAHQNGLLWGGGTQERACASNKILGSPLPGTRFKRRDTGSRLACLLGFLDLSLHEEHDGWRRTRQSSS